MAFNLLIVDDSSIVRKILIKTIGLSNIEVNSIVEAENGQEALEKINSNWVDLIFLDINMPVMNGVEFLEKIRNDKNLKETPVIIVSTEGSRDRIEYLEKLGISAYLRKPTTPEDLSTVVRDILLMEGK